MTKTRLESEKWDYVGEVSKELSTWDPEEVAWLLNRLGWVRELVHNPLDNNAANTLIPLLTPALEAELRDEASEYVKNSNLSASDVTVILEQNHFDELGIRWTRKVRGQVLKFVGEYKEYEEK